jgi:peptidoglycan hydrolase-like protein with peptidoglycan-binding domain
VGSKFAQSAILIIRRYPRAEIRGIKQTLRALGYDAGPPDASEGGPFASAVKAFQADHEPLERTGKLDEKTRAVFRAVTREVA